MYPFSFAGDPEANHRWVQGKSTMCDQTLPQSLTRGSDFQDVSVKSGGNPWVLENPGHIQLQGPVRQVVSSTVQDESKKLLPLPCPASISK